jgi:hypothetical protein
LPTARLQQGESSDRSALVSLTFARFDRVLVQNPPFTVAIFSTSSPVDQLVCLIRRLFQRQLTTLRRIEFRQFVEACGYVGMVRAERLFPDGERALETRLGLRVIALVVIQSSQVVQVLSHIGREGLKRSPLHRGLSRYVMGRQDLLLR